MQEHWLPKESLSYLNSVHSDFSARGISSVDYGDGFLVSVTIFSNYCACLLSRSFQRLLQNCMVLLYLALMYHKLLYIVPTLTYMMKPISYYNPFFLDDIINSLTDASDVIPTKTHNMFSKHTVPGWNYLVWDSHNAARKSSLIWRSAGIPRHGPFYDLMTIKRAQFKRNNRLCEEMLNLLKLSDLLQLWAVMILKTFGRASNKQIMPGYLT